MSNVKVFGTADDRTLAQIERCAATAEDEGVRAVLCADNHLGYSQPIGGAVAYPEHISPSGVGYDIGCGNKAVRTGITVKSLVGGGGSSSGIPAEEGSRTGAELKNEASGHAYSTVGKVMDEITRRISFGMGRANNEPADHDVLDAIREAPFAPQRQLYDLAAKQLGTVGAGNHYIDLFAGDDGMVWIGVHFGSRGFGHKTASGFLALAEGKRFGEHASEGEMDSPPILFHQDSDLGQSYIEAMTLAGAYAYAGRDVVVDKVLEILGTTAEYEVHNHHNFAWREEHGDTSYWVVRKGCTPAFPGQQGFVGATMGEPSVILEGVESPDSQAALYSTVHGAGRVMSRTQAAGKNRKRWACCNRDCDWFQGPGQHKPDDGICPKCGHPKLAKQMRQLSPGKVDWPTVRADLAERGIVLRGGAADEAPEAYKRLDSVLAAHSGTITVRNTLTPLGVAMAGPDVFDPFKD